MFLNSALYLSLAVNISKNFTIIQVCINRILEEESLYTDHECQMWGASLNAYKT